MPVFQLVKVLFLGIFSFVISMALTPLLTHFLYKYKCWKKKIRVIDSLGYAAPITAKLVGTGEIKTPRMGGILIWFVTLFLTVFFFFFSSVSISELGFDLNFLSRSQTWIPLFTLVVAGLLGLIDDIWSIHDEKKGFRFRHRLFLVSLLGLMGGSWLYFKLDWNTIHFPFISGDLFIGPFFILLFILVMDIFMAGSVVDGIDGLSGGIIGCSFASFTALALARGQYDLATFCAVIFGAILSFLWFNIPPARFYLGETGIISLTTTLAVVAFFTDSVLLLPFFAFIIILVLITNTLQILSKKFRHGKKIFLVMPINNYFRAKGWPDYKVTMRFWLISAITAVVGLIIALIDLEFLK